MAVLLTFLVLVVLTSTGHGLPHYKQYKSFGGSNAGGNRYRGEGYGRKEMMAETANKMWQNYESFDENKLANEMQNYDTQDNEKFDENSIPQKNMHPKWTAMESNYERFGEDDMANEMKYETLDGTEKEDYDYKLEEMSTPPKNDKVVPPMWTAMESNYERKNEERILPKVVHPMWKAIEEEIPRSQSSWNQLENGLLVDTASSISIDWGVNREGKVFFCEKPCTKWQDSDGILKQVDTSDNEIWGVNYEDKIFYRPIDNSKGWTHVEGRLKQVSASGNGYIWGVNSNNDVFKCRKPCPTHESWHYVAEKKLKQVDGGQEYVFGLDLNNHMFRRNIDGTGIWEQVHTSIKMKYVTVGLHYVYALSELCSGTHVYKCKLPCREGDMWKGMHPWLYYCLEQIDASINEVIGTAKDGKIFYTNAV